MGEWFELMFYGYMAMFIAAGVAAGAVAVLFLQWVF